MKKIFCFFLLGLSFLFLSFYLLYNLFVEFVNHMILLCASNDPIYTLFHYKNLENIDNALISLEREGYGKTAIKFLYNGFFTNKFVIMFIVLLVIYFVIFFSYTIYLNHITNKNNTAILQDIKNREYKINNPIVQEVKEIEGIYRNRINLIILDALKRKEENENLVHQIKSSISALALNIDLLKIDKDNKKIAERISNQTIRINKITSRFLEEVNLENMVNSYNFSVQDLSVSVINATKRIQTLADEKNIALNTVTFSVYLSMDNFWLEEAFETIMKNALTYADEGTIVNVVMKKAKDGLIIYISDQGKSLITDENIFVRYRKLNNDPNHYGIGLDMAKKIIEQHHGSIQAYNTEKIVVFEMFFPIHKLENFSL